MKRMLPIIILVVIVGAIAVGYYLIKNNGSYGSTQGANSSSSMPDMTSEPQNSSSTPESTDKVTIENFTFNPGDITVKKGTTVTWSNQDSSDHTVTETDGQEGPKSDKLAKGASYSFTYNAVGTYKYDCSIHPGMTGSVTVTE